MNGDPFSAKIVARYLEEIRPGERREIQPLLAADAIQSVEREETEDESLCFFGTVADRKQDFEVGLTFDGSAWDGECIWLFLAHYLRRRGLALPPLLEPVSDPAPIAGILRDWERAQEIERVRLHRVLRTPALHACTIHPDGPPFARKAERLRYELISAADASGDYALRLVLPDGQPVEDILFAVPGRPSYHFSAGAIYEGPPPHGLEAGAKFPAPVSARVRPFLLRRTKAALATGILGEESFTRNLTLDDLRVLFDAP